MLGKVTRGILQVRRALQVSAETVRLAGVSAGETGSRPVEVSERHRRLYLRPFMGSPAGLASDSGLPGLCTGPSFVHQPLCIYTRFPLCSL